ncbi:MAG: hypothetical protein LH468_13640, partial [Nocardioides sp.]|nr:hypothetical protein [Nocardioides sp.]
IVDAARARLVATGRPPGGRDATAVLVGTDLATLLVDTWTARCFGDGAPPWRDFLAQQVNTGHLPPRADLARAATRWSARVGPDRVVVVLGPARLPRQVGVRRELPARPALAAHATELARHVGPALGLLVTPPRAAQLLTEVLLPRLAPAPGERLVVPVGRMRWLRRQAQRQQRALSAGGYAVLGHPDLLLPRGHPGVAEPSEPSVLDLALRMLLSGPATASEIPGEQR